LPTDPEGKSASASPGPSPAILVAVTVLLAIAAAVFFVLPRWSAVPVVITPAATPRATASSPPEPEPPAPPRRSSAAPHERAAARPAPIREAADPPPAAPAPPSGFDAAVSDGLAALERGAAEEARAAFGRAEALRPGTGVVKDGLARADAILRSASLDRHRDAARAAEAAEDWSAARREYEAALRLEPAVRFAVEGAARATLRAQVSERLEAYIGRPERLSTPAVAEEAETALDRAGDIPSPGPRLQRQIDDLRRHLAAAGVPVTVRLLSDERTEVTVLRVGPQGRFREKSLKLRPGSYVVVGTRPGYRDARRTLVVPPGRSPEPLTVRCDEAL
jgi:hypothetical protein